MGWLGVAGTVAALASGITGTVLGVYNLIDTRRSRQWRLVVKLGYTVRITRPPDSADKRSRHWESIVTVIAVNIGLRDISLTEAGIILPNKTRLTSPFTLDPMPTDSPPTGGVTFPHDLHPGQNCTNILNITELTSVMPIGDYNAETLIRGYYCDALGNVYYSKPQAFDPARFSPEQKNAMTQTVKRSVRPRAEVESEWEL